MIAVSRGTTWRRFVQFTTRRSLRGALLFGLLLGGLPALQGPAYVATYPSAAERAQMVHALAGNPTLGILYGSNANDALTPSGYIVYRCLSTLLFAAGLWGLMTATRLFRGQEEDGRWELLLAGRLSPLSAQLLTTVGWIVALLAGFVVGGSIITLVGMTPQIDVSASAAFFFAMPVMLMALLFFGVGLLTSQLAASRRRAIMYGLIVLIGGYIVRAVEHVTHYDWLEWVTPFGWLEHTHPIVTSQPLWLLPAAGLAALCFGVTLSIGKKRDLGDSVIAEPDTARSRMTLLGGTMGLALRLNWPLLVSWIAIALVMTGIIAGITHTAVSTVTNSESLSKAVAKLAGGEGGLALSFTSMTTFFGSLVFMLMAAAGIASIRKEESKLFLENILVRPIGRLRWLTGRLAVLFGSLVCGVILSSVLVWVIAHSQAIYFDAWRYMVESLNVLGPICIVLGVGILLYGWLPRFATAAAYLVLGWSFLLDLIGSAAKLPLAVVNTSLFHHIAMTPLAHPRWSTVAYTTCIGVILTSIGMVGFVRRDLQGE